VGFSYPPGGNKKPPGGPAVFEGISFARSSDRSRPFLRQRLGNAVIPKIKAGAEGGHDDTDITSIRAGQVRSRARHSREGRNPALASSKICEKHLRKNWIPAFAGMTSHVLSLLPCPL
jgi:hypothetical protein